ncbi:CCAAT- binding transcription factor component [Coniosporium apollinis]|uniref:CCAAT- binding transcription factor component n=1 Tax=Coniosporium apollinis TaxID=61459 RepID=A0ABQ9NP89_9PEZI|nr:CCAAT- binding transcription factor component [Coniosporium apollinis]
MDPSGQQKSRQQQHPAPRRYDGVNGNPLYDPQNGGHYGASANIAANGHAPAPEIFTGPWANVNQGLSGTYRDILNTYWQQQVSKLETDDHDYKLHQLPLARIKKVMKADPEVKMISAEAPILFAKGCDIFITELTMRAWIHAEENKRRTLQRSDIASALAKSDMFDFLIDIVPREDASGHKRGGGSSAAQASASAPAVPQAQVQQQTGVHPPPHDMGDYRMGQHMQQAQDYRQQPAIYAPPVQGDPSGYGQPQPQMFDQGLYGAYALQSQQMYQGLSRGPDPTGAVDPNNPYRTHGPPEGDEDAEGEREDYGP